MGIDGFFWISMASIFLKSPKAKLKAIFPIKSSVFNRTMPIRTKKNISDPVNFSLDYEIKFRVFE